MAAFPAIHGLALCRLPLEWSLRKLSSMKFSDLGAHTIAASKHVATRSVLNPLLWLCGIISLPSLIVAAFVSGPLLTALIVLGVAPPAATLLAYLFFMFSDPNRLQSEEFVLQQQLVAAQIGDNRTKEVLEIPVEMSGLTANTVLIEASRG